MSSANEKLRFIFPATFRIKKRGEFQRIQRSGKKMYSKHFLIIVAPSDRSESRLGVTVSRKVSKRAVRRNLVKRRIREIFRLYRSRLREALDIVIIARDGADACSYADMRKEILGTLKHNGYLISG